MDIFRPADILLPRQGLPMETWAVIACDQHTGEPAYWEKAEALVADAPSTLRITLPEIYLEKDNSARIEAINSTMTEYLENGLFTQYANAYVYVERTLANGQLRRGIVGAIDLCAYDFHKGSQCPIRATEATVPERIPPRVKIRENAPLEAPHAMLLINDAAKSVIEPLGKAKKDFCVLYDFDLMLGGGHITGYLVDQDSSCSLEKALDRLAAESSLVFAVGDGNHSLATAKTCYEEKPSPLARYALCEIVNIHDDSLAFEPIYRVLFDVEPQSLLADMKAYFGQKNAAASHRLLALYGDEEEEISLPALSALAVTDLQNYLDLYLAAHPIVRIDYIHGKDETKALCHKANTLGFLFDGMKKEELFPAVEQDGSLVRKTFSMGEACDKRYYVEARKIR